MERDLVDAKRYILQQGYGAETDFTVNLVAVLLANYAADSQTKAVTRLEVIDENGRSYVNKSPHNVVELSLQDEGRTLKVFVGKK